MIKWAGLYLYSESDIPQSKINQHQQNEMSCAGAHPMATTQMQTKQKIQQHTANANMCVNIEYMDC